jgi:hypothetical protein
MSILAKVFGRKPARELSPMEAYVAQLTPRSMNAKIRTIGEEFKVPTAQAMAVMAFAGSFANGLRESAGSMPNSMWTDWPFPFEKIVTEAAGFYFYFIASPYLSQPDENGEYPDDDRNPDPYFGTLIHRLSGETISDRFVGGRVATYSDVKRRKAGLVEALHGFIMKAWNPTYSERASLDLAAPTFALEASIASMPIEAVRDTCRERYDEKARNPNAY